MFPAVPGRVESELGAAGEETVPTRPLWSMRSICCSSPSAMYESAQSASVRTSFSVHCSSAERNGSAFVTYLRNDYGLPRQMSCRTPSFREFIGG